VRGSFVLEVNNGVFYVRMTLRYWGGDGDDMCDNGRGWGQHAANGAGTGWGTGTRIYFVGR